MEKKSGSEGSGRDGDSKENSKLISINGGRRSDHAAGGDLAVYDNFVSEQYYYDEKRRLRTRLSSFLFQKVNFPNRFWLIAGPDIPLDQRPLIKDWLEKWENFERPETGLYLFGPLAKSEVVFAVCMKEVMRRNHTTFTISALEIADFVLKNPEMTEYEAVDKLCSVGLLGVYNLGREHRDSFGTMEACLSKVFNRRRDNGRPIVFSTELIPTQIKSNYLPQVHDGIFHTSRAVECY